MLSAGGMFGAFQAGVWQEISRVFAPDIVVGASIGSLNGWMIAGGVDPGDLAARWLALDDAAHHRLRFPRGLADGLVDCNAVESWIRTIHSEFRPRVEYGLVATEMPKFVPRLFRWPDLEWRHLACSCAVPLFLRQYRIEGRWYSDGGLMLPLPLWAAVEMGARRIVSVNLLAERPPLIQAFADAARWYCRWKPELPRGVEVLEINPAGRLGSARDSLYWSRANAERWLAEGRKAARAALPALEGTGTIVRT